MSTAAAPAVSSEQEKPPRVQPSIKAAPKIRQMFWCDYPEDAQLPELWKPRPVIIVSYKNTLHGCVTVIPCSTHPPRDEWGVELSQSLDGRKSWAICDKVSSMAVSRLSSPAGQIPRLDVAEFDMVLAKLLKWLPKIDGTAQG